MTFRGGTTLIAGSGKGHLTFACTTSHHQKHLAYPHLSVALSCMPPRHAMHQKPLITWNTCSHALTCSTYLLGACTYVTTSFDSQKSGVPRRQYRPLLPAPSNRRLVRGFNDSVSVGVLPLTLFPNGHVYFTQKLHEVSLPPVQFFQLLHCQIMLSGQS